MNKLSSTSFKHPYLTLILCLAVGAYAMLEAKRLTLDANLTALLPDNFKSVQDLEIVKKRFGGIGYIVVTASGTTPDKLKQFADHVNAAVQNLPDISFVDHKRDVDFFKDRTLYYLDKSDLATIEKRIQKRYKWEKRKQNPMYIDFEESEPPPLDFSDIKDKYAQDSSSWMSSRRSDEPYYMNSDQSMIAIFIKPNIGSADLYKTAELLDRVKARIHTIDTAAIDPLLQYEYTGRYQKNQDMQSEMQKDLGIASTVATFMVLLYLFIHFRRIDFIFMVVLPLLLGIILTFGFASLVYGQLNILTAFIGVILLGLGIDHGIHILSRYRDEKRKGASDQESIDKAFGKTGKAVTLAAVTTLITFLGLSVSEFRAFFEFGVIASAGMTLIVLCYLIVMPPLLKLGQYTGAWRSRENVQQQQKVERVIGFYQRHSLIILSITAIVLLGSLLNLVNVKFNYDFESLGNSQIRSFQLDKQVNDLLGYSQTPMVALTTSLDEERFVTRAFKGNDDQSIAESGIDFILSSTDLVPNDQAEKRAIIDNIASVLDRVKRSWLKEEDAEKFDELKRLTAVPVFDHDALPNNIQRLFGYNPGVEKSDGVVMLFPRVSLSDGDGVIRLAEEIRRVHQSDGQALVVAGESMIVADILSLVFKELPRILLICVALIFIVLLASMRNMIDTLLCIFPVVATIIVCLGVLPVLGIELNYINVIMIIILLGIGVDSGIHFVSRILEGDSVFHVLNDTGLAIMGSVVTSGLGFAALLLTNHHGLATLAQIGLIGLAINLWVSVVVLPTLLQRRRSRSPIGNVS